MGWPAPALAAVLAMAQPGPPPTMVQVGRVTVVAWPDEVALASRLAQLADQPAEWPGLGRRDPGPLRLIVVPIGRFDQFTRRRAPEWGAGVALPGSRTILLKADGTDLLQTLRHELAHLALHEAVRVRVPLWFDEGYAAWAAGEWDRLDALRLNLAVVQGQVPDFRALDGALRATALTASTAYALATSAVLELARRNPTRTLVPLMRRLERGDDFDDAVRATTGVGLGVFEIEWQRAIRHRYTLFTWLAAGGVWGICALLLGVAAWARRHRDRGRRAALDEGWEIPEPEGDAVLDPHRTGE
ncbi:MAG: peptidase MA family metallohydrolase [Gemmatimonadota bacterium]